MSHPYEGWMYSVGDPVQDFDFDACEVPWAEISKYARQDEVAEEVAERDFFDSGCEGSYPQKVYLYRADRMLAGTYTVDMEVRPHFYVTEEHEPEGGGA